MSITIFHIIKMLGLKIHENPQFVAQPNMIAALPGMGNVVGIGIGFLTKNLTQSCLPRFTLIGLHVLHIVMALLIIHRRDISSIQ
jgi:F0F1-type ATP synthase assembly protein I